MDHSTATRSALPASASAAATTPERTGPADRSLGARLRRWQVGLPLEATLAALALLSGLATYAAMSSQPDPGNPQTDLVSTLLTLDLLLLLPLTLLIGRRIVKVWVDRRQGSAGSRLHVRMAVLFSAIAAVPPAFMALASALFLQYGLEAWFSRNVRDTVHNSLAVAEAYMEEHREGLRLDISLMSSDLDSSTLWLQENPDVRMQQFIRQQALARSLSEVIVFYGTGDQRGRVLAKWNQQGLDIATNRVPEDLLAYAETGRLVVATNTNDNKVFGLIKPNAMADVFLYASRHIDSRVLNHVSKARSAVEKYANLEGSRSGLHLQFNMIFVTVAVVLMLVAMLIGLLVADRLVNPISNLVGAAERVRRGDLAARVGGRIGDDELGMLSRAFNRMTRQLEQQQTQLVDTNRELDERRRFLEAVLGDVSAGVIGLRADGTIHLPNRSACHLLESDAETLVGAHLGDVVPEMAGLLTDALDARECTAQSHVTVERGSGERVLLARLTVQNQDGTVLGFVLTFDDITDQLVDQRNAAWADVARRIAHEIKNPLTPIQLSAERLKRRFGAGQGDAPVRDTDIIEKCTGTIIRQVDDLRRMVDEFSSFARMPAPRYEPTNVAEVVRQSVFLQEVTTPGIALTLDKPEGAVMLTCDGRLLSQALTNIMKNAAESISTRIARDKEAGRQPAKGAIHVSLSQDEGLTILRVEDNGLGLPKQRNRLTEPYVTTRAKGTGLGLAIVKKIVEEHGGRLLLDNRRDGGASVRLEIAHAALHKRIAKAAEDRGETNVPPATPGRSEPPRAGTARSDTLAESAGPATQPSEPDAPSVERPRPHHGA
ncbi:hypothetical protein CCR80_13475 [Rhodothalassium salexigens]|uniref:sensor histidine kinase NtrY-like n=1 Tax=Rhodothalassium salexigens TaxID=1086 RepID=UPI001911D5F1|nr:PAS domain-containing sensor histidine kinase [Rhodothalassium salexigens]MBK5922045.1 hypothetical protein [Rhodothalassium salexigens]